MPQALTYPGVYLQELPSGSRTITGVATSITAFIGRAARGPVDEPTTVFNFGEFARTFGGLHKDCPMSYSVQQFFMNGGGQAIIVRRLTQEDGLVGADKPQAAKATATGLWIFRATSNAVGAAGNGYVIEIEAGADPDNFKMRVKKPDNTSAMALTSVTFGDPAALDFVNTKLAAANVPIRAQEPVPQAAVPVGNYTLANGVDAVAPADAVQATASAAVDLFEVFAVSEGEWGNRLRVLIDHAVAEGSSLSTFNLTIEEYAPGADRAEDPPVRAEKFFNVSTSKSDLRFVGDVIGQESSYIDVEVFVQDALPSAGQADLTQGQDGKALVGDDVVSALDLLDAVDLFNLLVLPPPSWTTEYNKLQRDLAVKKCFDHDALFVMDPPAAWNTYQKPRDELANEVTRHKNAAIFFPTILAPNPLNENRQREFTPSGAIAGLMARTDAGFGVWKAPAGIDATLLGVSRLKYRLTDAQNGVLNQVGVNCLRTFPVIGTVSWGARTLRGADVLADEWKYLPVRRTALYIKQSLLRGTQWAVFQPNDAPLWAELRKSIGSFMHQMFRKHAFQGSSPKEAYFVKCDGETTTQADINLGIVNIFVGFAPLKPAEFVVISLQQIAGESSA